MNLIQGWPGYKRFHWLIFLDSLKSKLIGRYEYCYVKEGSPGYEENSFFYIHIDEEYRRQGLGSLILKKIALEILDKSKCKYLETDVYYKSGMKFCEKVNARIINEGSENRLYLKDVD